MTRMRSGHKRTRKPKGVMSAEQTPQGADPNLLLLMQEMLRDRQLRSRRYAVNERRSGNDERVNDVNAKRSVNGERKKLVCS